MPKYPINTGAWPTPDWNLDPGHDKVSPAELKRIKDSFPKHEPLPSKEYTPSKETERRVRYMAWCFDMHNLLTRLLDWIWKRIE